MRRYGKIWNLIPIIVTRIPVTVVVTHKGHTAYTAEVAVRQQSIVLVEAEAKPPV